MTETHPSEAIRVTGEDLLIRRMRTSDVTDIMPIESVSFGKHHWSSDSFLYEMKNQMGRYYSLFHKPTQKLIGYCGYWVILDEAHITTIAVDNTYRGNGLGEVLLIKMLDKMAGQSVKWATLEVRISNTPAQNLYYKYLFRSMGVRPHYYQDTSEDALIMTTDAIQEADFRAMLKSNRATLLERLNHIEPEGWGDDGP